MTKEKIKTEIEALEIHVKWLLDHGSNDEEINTRLRYLKIKLNNS